MRNKRKNKIFLIIVLILGLSIGFAALSTTLKLNGSAIISKNTWSVYWDRIGDIDKSDDVNIDSAAVIDSNDHTKINFEVTLNLPGDYYEFQVDAVNAGTLDAMLNKISLIMNDNNSSLPDYIKYSIVYVDGSEPNQYDLLVKAGNEPTRERFKIKLWLDSEMTLEQMNSISENGDSYAFSLLISYTQADENAFDVNFFKTASWNRIIAAYNNGNYSKSLEYAMKNGITKDIVLNEGTSDEVVAKVRIANLSTPSECNDNNYSQTACGFVIEFAEIVTTKTFNYYNKSDWARGEGEGSWGGWEHSDMRAYLNGGTYRRENKDYSTNSFLSMLPSDLRNKIIDTKVSYSSNHGGSIYTAFTTDKLYLFSPREVYGDSYIHPDFQYDSLFNSGRQLDYYEEIGAAADDANKVKLIKSVINPESQDWSTIPPEWSTEFWALRTVYARSGYDSSFFRVLKTGDLGYTYSCHHYGVSPAFRIAKVN